MLRLVALVGLAFAASYAAAQPAEPLEYHLPQAVQDTVAAHVASLPAAERDAPFLVWRGWRDGAYELAVATGETLPCDSLLLARTNRVARISGAAYKIVLADDDAFAVHGWTDSPFETGPGRLPKQCATLRHGLFVVRFDQGPAEVLNASREP
ncbi:MAG: hypothetical protein AAGN64_11405 [Bacteroidota bacterium]